MCCLPSPPLNLDGFGALGSSQYPQRLGVLTVRKKTPVYIHIFLSRLYGLLSQVRLPKGDAFQICAGMQGEAGSSPSGTSQSQLSFQCRSPKATQHLNTLHSSSRNNSPNQAPTLFLLHWLILQLIKGCEGRDLLVITWGPLKAH